MVKKIGFITFILSHIPMGLLTGLSLLTFFAAVLANVRFYRPSVDQMNNGHSNAFHGEGISDWLQLPAPENTLLLPKEGISFTLPVTSNLPLFSFYYQCSPACPQLWLTFSQGNVKGKLLVHHPIFDSLEWFWISYADFSLFRKKWVPEDQLLDGSMLTESTIMPYFEIPPARVFYLEDTDTLPSDTDVILSTFFPPYQNRDWFNFKRRVLLPEEFELALPIEWRLMATGESSSSGLVKISRFGAGI